MTCCLFSHARDSGENTGSKNALAALNALEALEIIDKCRVINSSSAFF